MSAKKKTKTRSAVHAATVIALLAASAYLTVELRKEEQAGAPGVQSVGAPRHTGKQIWERLQNPDRTVLRDKDGQVLATFTDNARTATLTGPSRTFAEPAATTSRVVTEDWVRLMPEPWRKGAENERWFKDWFAKNYGSTADDVFAMAFQYVPGAPAKKNGKGIPDKEQARSLDASGYQRLVWGRRAHYPLAASDTAGGGLPRTANGMARSRIGADIIPLKGVGPAHRPRSADLLQPGDLAFFKLDARAKHRVDHVGIYLGHDADGQQIFLSSRKEANGPTLGDENGTSRPDGSGDHPRTLRSAKRL
ncbi:NlpC/P60 family protein [Streptomyces chattanoogensis]|uniref:C40 family peptidase n=1 Tax=Streptomyces chattanoogensis TaxID=66876 RepID=UPI0005D81261|nr:hypothetical protein T261_4028 [Streptomyces lydicus]